MAEQDPESLESEAPPQGPKLPLDVTVADLRSLLQLLRSPEDALKIHATRSLLLYAQGDAKCFASVIKLGVGIAEGTIMLPRAEDGALSEEEELLWRVNEYGCVAFFASFLEQSDGLRLAGLEILAHLTTDQGIRDNVRILNAFPFLGSALEPAAQDIGPRSAALKIVCNFAAELTPNTLAELRVLTSAEGAANLVLPAVVQMYQKDADLELIAIQVIALMSRDYESRVRFRELGAVKKMIIAMSDYRRPKVQLASVNALFWLCEDGTNRLECCRFNGFQRMLRLMEDGDKPELGIAAAQVLAKCCQEVDNRDAMRDFASIAMLHEGGERVKDGLEKLLDILGDKHVTPEVIRAALNALANCSYDSLSCQLISEVEASGLVVRLLASGAGGKSQVGLPPKASAAIVLGNMARQPELRLEIVRAGAVNATVRALNDKEVSTQEQAADTLTRLAMDATAVVQMKKAGAVKRLVELTAGQAEGPNRAATNCLSNYVVNNFSGEVIDENCIEVLNEGAVEPIVQLLGENHMVATRCAAAWAIRNLALNGDVRDHLDSAGATEMLATMLNNDHLELVLAAIGACKTSVVEEAVANNLCLHGGYTFLTRLSDNSPFETVTKGCKEVIDQLLKINLAMKFWLQGRLDSDIKTKDGFFALFGNSGFRTADELRKEAVDDQNLEILQVDQNTDIEYSELLMDTLKQVSMKADTFQAKVKLLANIVCDRMGGAVTHTSINNLGFAQEISLIKSSVNSHVVPIGKVRRGALRHRAFLFKTLADTLEVPCTLERSKDGWRLWNCITVKGTEQRVVDLMSSPGQTYTVGTQEYCRYIELEVLKDPVTNQQHGCLPAPAKRGKGILDENLFPHSAIGYKSVLPHFTCPSNLLKKTSLLHHKSGPELVFQTAGKKLSRPSLGSGQGIGDDAREYHTVLHDTTNMIRSNAGHESEAELVRAAYDWMISNIRYAYGKGSGRHTGGDPEPQQVLMRRRATSVGFSNLYKELCETLGLEAHVIKGHCKLYDMLRGKKSQHLKIQRPDDPEDDQESEPAVDESPLEMVHAWNAVKVQGDWKLVDSSAATYLVAESGEVQGFCMLSQDLFLLDHFPEDEQWQLQPQGGEIMDQATFRLNRHLRPGAQHLHVKLQSHPGATASPKCEAAWSTQKYSLVVARAPEGVLMSAKLLEFGGALPDSMVLVHRRGEEFFIHGIGPSHGTYTLRLFAQSEHDPDLIPTWICDYTIEMGSVLKQGNIGFLGRYPGSEATVGFIHQPSTINLQSHTTHFFDIEMPGMDQICVGTCRKWGSLNKLEGAPEGFNESFGVDGRFQGRLFLEEGDCELLVYAKKNGGQFKPYFQYLSL